MSDDADRPAPNDGRFPATQWSVVLAAREDSADALDRLCRTYWPAVFAFARRQGDSVEEARDLTQGFFEQLLGRRWLDGVDAGLGRFRSFLMKAFTRHARGEWRKSQQLKRGGGLAFLSLDEMRTEAGGRPMAVEAVTPEVDYERRWVEALIHSVMVRLRGEFEASGKAELFAVLKPFLTDGRQADSYASVAADAGLSESAVKSAIYRMRQRYGEIFREEVAHTVVSPDEVEDEIRYLLGVMGRR
jgi:RNA polymerase sigma-70 factor (ECF subfamily)